MCFSAEASFGAAVILTAAGAVTLSKCQKKEFLWLASTPLLFGIQQFAEGLLWLHFQNDLDSTLAFYWTKRIFLTFAFLVWPIWIPLAIGLAEKIKFRRYLIFFDLACGIALSALNLSYALKQEILVEIVNHSIQYTGEVPPQTFLYPMIVLIPCFISTLKKMWIFGTLALLGYIVAYYFYATTFVSVWCFFAAIVSLVIYKIIIDNQTKESSKSTLSS